MSLSILLSSLVKILFWPLQSVFFVAVAGITICMALLGFVFRLIIRDYK